MKAGAIARYAPYSEVQLAFMRSLYDKLNMFDANSPLINVALHQSPSPAARGEAFAMLKQRRVRLQTAGLVVPPIGRWKYSIVTTL